MTRPVTSSSAARVVRRLPVTNRPIGTRREPFADASSTSASRASRFGSPSAAGEALHTLPTTVARAWIWAPPMASAAALRPSNSRGNLASTRSVQVVSAPIRQPSPVCAMPRNPGSAVISSTSSWAARPTRAG
jgi:hypothetical protein